MHESFKFRFGRPAGDKLFCEKASPFAIELALQNFASKSIQYCCFFLSRANEMIHADYVFVLTCGKNVELVPEDEWPLMGIKT